MNINAIKNEKNGVPFITFPLLEQAGVKHAVTTKLGGVSKGDCATMNLSFARGDDPADVIRNHERLAEAIGYEVSKEILSSQVHDTVVRRVDSSDYGKGIKTESDLIGVDGFITNDPEAVLMIFFADCVPLFFYDKRNKAIGASHSGWRGTVQRIGARTVEAMHDEFGTNPEDLLAVIGPSICQDCYEVSEDVAVQFEKEFITEYWTEILQRKPKHKYQLDLWRANEIILREAGIPAEQIQISGLCTCCNSQLLFSHRAAGGRRGNLSGIITLGGIS